MSLEPGQRRLLENLKSRGMPNLYETLKLVDCPLTDACNLEDRGFVKIEGNDDEEDPHPVIFITEAGKDALSQR